MRTGTDWIAALRVVAVLAVLGAAPASAGDEPPPNIVFFLVDDLGWRDLRCFGSSFYDTPHLDRLAARGVRFTEAYAAAPVCSPTRASILTGLHPARLRTTDYFGAPQPERWKRETALLPAPYLDRLPLERVTIAEALGERGYRTFFAGKWHLGGEGHFPEDQGFEINRGGLARGGPYGGKKYFSPYGNPRLADGPEGEHLPARLARETSEFIESCGDRPFFAYLSFYSVHTPLMAREDLRRKYEERAAVLEFEGPRWGKEGKRKVRLVQDHAVYAGMVEAMDQAVGEVLDTLTRLGLDERTVVVFFSDNGGLSTSEGHPTSNLPLRAGKGWLYEGGVREPMIVRWPGVTEAGTTCAVPVTSTDFFPTLLEIAGAAPDPGTALDGVSLTPLLRGEAKAAAAFSDRPLFWHYPHYGNQGGSPSSAIRVGDWKLLEFFEDDRIELYDLARDPGEREDRAKAEPERAEALLGRLRDWRTAVDARYPRRRTEGDD